MKNIINLMFVFTLLLLSTSVWAWKWIDLWQTADQQASALLKTGHAREASTLFKNKAWQAVSQYRAENYTQALQQFKHNHTSDGQYNAGNAAAQLGHYPEAIHYYDKAIALNPQNKDAMFNRELIKKLMKSENKDNKDNKDNKEENKKNNSKNKSTADQKPDNDAKNQSANNHAQPSNGSNPPTQPPANPSAQSKNNQANSQPKPQDSQAKPSSQPGSTSPTMSNQNEDKNQLMRRVSDDPGGLLRQKFLRDYLRRHNMGADPDQGDN